ncbi:hypothetical protein HHI36_020549 [Cryptolaemus montrouzieri]|uniref:Uncharacterized protein n=1 Tax=Cryptolaemus montrouzieri TaxID=559131 RepID=A0ABD2NAK9_9CUCU
MIANTEEEKAKSDRQSVESSSKNDLTADSIEISKRLDVEKNDSCDPDFDVPRFFMNADQGALREFIRKELELLKRMDFKVKDFFYRYFPYEEDDEKPKSLQNISSLKNGNITKN